MVIDIDKIRCRCGGKLVNSQCEVDFFGLGLGIKKCKICKECNAEYLHNETMQIIESDIKKRNIFGLEG